MTRAVECAREAAHGCTAASSGFFAAFKAPFSPAKHHLEMVHLLLGRALELRVCGVLATTLRMLVLFPLLASALCLLRDWPGSRHVSVSYLVPSPLNGPSLRGLCIRASISHLPAALRRVMDVHRLRCPVGRVARTTIVLTAANHCSAGSSLDFTHLKQLHPAARSCPKSSATWCATLVLGCLRCRLPWVGLPSIYPSY